ncbi:hypothetical protein PTI98_012738 [Pleurotus ostreatus]|nr:hypothetical protein PTI98_012738 [Pleurotus ostreatus]
MADSDHKNLQTYQKNLTELKSLIARMPNGVPNGLPTGPIAKYFGDAPVIDPTEGLYRCLNQAWDRVFQCSDDKKAALVVKGPYGLGCIVHFVEAIAASPNIGANGVLFLGISGALPHLYMKLI